MNILEGLYPGLVQFHGYNWAMDGCVPDVDSREEAWTILCPAAVMLWDGCRKVFCHRRNIGSCC